MRSNFGCLLEFWSNLETKDMAAVAKGSMESKTKSALHTFVPKVPKNHFLSQQRGFSVQWKTYNAISSFWANSRLRRLIFETKLLEQKPVLTQNHPKTDSIANFLSAPFFAKDRISWSAQSEQPYLMEPIDCSVNMLDPLSRSNFDFIRAADGFHWAKFKPFKRETIRQGQTQIRLVPHSLDYMQGLHTFKMLRSMNGMLSVPTTCGWHGKPVAAENVT